MKKHAALIALLFFMTTALSGCWDARELDTLAIITMVWIDEGDSPDTVTVGIQVSQGKNSGDSQGVALSNISDMSIRETGRSVFDCFKQFEDKDMLTPFLEHNQAIVVSSALAKKCLSDYLAYFLRDNESRLDVWLFIAQGSAREISENYPEEGESIGIKLGTMMDRRKQLSPHLGTSLLDYYRMLGEKQASIVIPVVSGEKQGDASIPVIRTLAVIANDRMAGTLDAEEIAGLNWVHGGFDSMEFSSRSDAGEATYKAWARKGQVVPRFEGGEVFMDVYISANVAVLDVSGYKSVRDADLQATLMLHAKWEIDRLIKKSLARAQALSADIFGFGDALYAHFPREWASLKDNWTERFQKMRVDVRLEIEAAHDNRFANPEDIEVILRDAQAT